jgi:hypothetical protein
LHFDQRTLLVRFIAEPNEPVSTGLTGHCVGHDFGRFAGWETRLEERYQDEFVDLGTEVSDENAKFGATVIAGSLVSRKLSQ